MLHFSDSVEEVLIRQSRLEKNDRGALFYQNTGEIGPSLMFTDCSISNNGYLIYGNITSSEQAVQLHLHNTVVSYCIYLETPKVRNHPNTFHKLS